VKRMFDVAVSGILLAVLSPVIAVIAGLVRWKMGRPVLFRQSRPGLGGQPFVMLKFRSMRPASMEEEAAGDEARVTRLGRFLRASSLDELPELWNVLRGDMSLVGPRPLLMEYLPLYTTEQARRHDVRPGLTGWAQVNGRNAIRWEEKFALDVWYVENRSMWLDLKILAMTVVAVLRRHGIDDHNGIGQAAFRASSDLSDLR
jgi:sugar transferase EpsL